MSNLSLPSGWLFPQRERFFLSCKLSFFQSIGCHAVQLELVSRPLGTCSQKTVAPTSTQGKARSRYGLVFFFLWFSIFLFTVQYFFFFSLCLILSPFSSTFLCFFTNIYIFFHLFLKFLRDGAGEGQNFYALTFDFFHFVLFMLQTEHNSLIISKKQKLIISVTFLIFYLFFFF